MNAPNGPLRPFYMVLVLLTIAVILDRYILATLLPWISQSGGISLVVVFLDIPLALPVIDLIPVTIIFCLLYPFVSLTYASLAGITLSPTPGRRLGIILSGALGFLCWILIPALAFYCTQSFLPREIHNGINSFGLNLDLYTPYPEEPIIHLQGSMLVLIFFIIGLTRYARNVNQMIYIEPEPVAVAKEQVTTNKRSTRIVTRNPTNPVPKPIKKTVPKTPSIQSVPGTTITSPVPRTVPAAKPQLMTESVPVVAPLRVIAPLPVR